MRKLALLILFFILSELGLYLQAQPLVEIYLNSRGSESRGPAFKSVEELHEVLVLDQAKTPSFRVVKQFNAQGKVVSEIKYNSAGGVQNEVRWKYNINGYPIRKTTHQFINYKGWVNEEITLKYNDTTGYLNEINKSVESKIINTALVSCDSTGRIVEVRVFNEKGELSGIDRLIYVPANNLIRVLSYKANDQFVMATAYPLDPNKPEPKSTLKREFNSHGDVILELLPGSKIGQGYYYEYSYDTFGNWTEKLTYQCTVTPNGNVKDKKLEHRITRKIVY